MEENKNHVHLGDGVADKVTANFNENMADTLGVLFNTLFGYAKEKIKDLPQGIEDYLNRPESRQEITTLWSNQLREKGLIPNGYNGLSDERVIANLHQTGYLEGLYVGYALAMMALVDNNAAEELICSVRDDIRPNLIGHHYDERNEFIQKYKGEKYNWVESFVKNE